MEVRYKTSQDGIVPVIDQRVYAIQCEGFFKIGVSSEPDKRAQSIQSSNPFECELLGHIRGGPIVERNMHKRLGAYKERGEWFIDCPEVREVVRIIVEGDLEALDQFMPTEDEIAEGFEAILKNIEENC